MTSNLPQLSVVVPLHNEAENVEPLLTELRALEHALGFPLEVVAVNDGSADATGRLLDEAAARWTALRVMHLERNAGQGSALWCGFAAARGEWIATLDGDGQNPPMELARLWALREQADMVMGCRAQRNDSALRKGMSRVANAVRRRLLRDGVRDAGCALKVFRREVCAAFLPMLTLYSFLPAFAVAGGWTVLEVPVQHRPRRSGVSHYGLLTMAWRPLVDMLALCWLLRRLVPVRPGVKAAARASEPVRPPST